MKFNAGATSLEEIKFTSVGICPQFLGSVDRFWLSVQVELFGVFYCLVR